MADEPMTGWTFDPTTRPARALFLVVRVSVAIAVTLGGWAFLRLGPEVSTLLGAFAAYVVTTVEGLLHGRVHTASTSIASSSSTSAARPRPSRPARHVQLVHGVHVRYVQRATSSSSTGYVAP